MFHSITFGKNTLLKVSSSNADEPIEDNDLPLVELYSLTCEVNGCTKVKLFGNINERIARFCKTHSPNGFINLTSKVCQVLNCPKRPFFGRPNYGAEFCKKHAPYNYVNVTRKRCQKQGCVRHPSFGVPKSGAAKFCRRHAPKEFVNVRRTKKKSQKVKVKHIPVYVTDEE